MTTPAVDDVSTERNPLLVRIRRLVRDPAAYRRLGQCWAAGEHLGLALSEAGQRAAVAVVVASAWDRLAPLANLARRQVRVPDQLMRALGDLDSPAPIGFLLDCQAPAAVLPGLASVWLDRLQDPGNVGSILRSAGALGVRQVLATKGTAALWSPKVLRAAMGAHFSLHLVEGLDSEALYETGLPVVATSSHGAQVLCAVRLPDPCVWIVGHEGQGVDPALLARANLVVRIPQPGGQESLNVAAAAAICLYESVRQRTSGPAVGHENMEPAAGRL